MKPISEFLLTFLTGKVTCSINRPIRFGADRCKYGRWDYYVLHCGPFAVMVSK